MVMNTLGVLGNDVPQSIIFAVCLLAFGCAVDNEWDQASSHLGALHRILDARGGVETVDFELQRTFTWVSYSFAGALRLPPQFPPPLFGAALSFPLAFLDDAQIRAWRTAKRFPKNCGFVFDIAARLHQIGLSGSPEYYEDIDQRALSNVYFEATHHALAIQVDEPWTQILTKGNQAQEHSTMFQTWAAGLSLYIWGTDRHARRSRGLASNGELHGPIFARIKEILDGAGGHQSWPRGKSLEPILVTLFYALDACDIFSPWRIWLVDTARKVIEMLKLKRSEEFLKVLEFFPLTPDYRVAAEHTWAEIIQKERVTPTLTFSTLQ
ncbi:hypothetical protein K491DRAFT_445687 [Lophiostoma macrostomum CBS 122681]|uniref:Transcription factor domain-containing protein n=1 Tax=Lophiostoma macrostomum CBS 122681 TaxID=1314788 RepID=A0A6A6T6L2_9PLEO|nr:hypothetical protein K491DRAFT_445687 [Lophiostoma macrostomum CBS 122681]